MSPVSWVWSGLRAALGENLRYDGSQMGGPALIQWGNRYAHFSATASEVLLDESRGSVRTVGTGWSDDIAIDRPTQRRVFAAAGTA